MSEQAFVCDFDLLVIGGGVNGCGIARDAAGRGLNVALVEMGDLAQGTSSASTKLIHGGLRYLEYHEFSLVREALIERERLLRIMPHIAWPIRIVLPHHRHLRPAWLLRLGLFIYDHLGGRKLLPPTRQLDLRRDVTGKPLKACYRRAFEYSDCWVDDSRLVVLNARDAASRGAVVWTRTICEKAERQNGCWEVSLREMSSGEHRTVRAKAIVNAGGAWVDTIIRQQIGLNSADGIRLVRGSHIVMPKLFDHDRAYVFQQADGRVVFAIPYEDAFTLIGTTDVDHESSPSDAICTPEEARYLCEAVSSYFAKPVSTDDIIWAYSGVRPLYDDGAESASAVTRDYVLKLDTVNDRAPLLNVFGGKITTYRRLAEAALTKLEPFFPDLAPAWTETVPLPGGDFHHDEVDAIVERLQRRFGFLDRSWARRMIRAYGTDAFEMLGDATSKADLGPSFGASLTAREVAWLMDREWARSSEDVLWRRSKLGLRISETERSRLDAWMTQYSESLAS